MAASSNSIITSKLQTYSSFFEVTPNSPILPIRVNLIFLQKDNGSGNFRISNSNEIQFVRLAVSKASWWLSNLMTNIPPNITPCSSYVSDSRIALQIGNEIEIKNDSLWGIPYGCPYNHPFAVLAQYFDTLYPPAMQFFFFVDTCWYEWLASGECSCNNTMCNLGYSNYCCSGNFSCTIVNGSYPTPGGCSMLPSFSINRYTFINYSNNYIHYLDASCEVFRKSIVGNTSSCYPLNIYLDCINDGLAELILHEVAHALFVQYSHNNSCGHLLNTYFGRPIALTPTQVADMRAALSLMNVRRFVVGCPYSSTDTLTIAQNFTWDADARLYRSVAIKNNAVVRLTTYWRIPTNATIHVYPGATLIVDSGQVVNGCGQCGTRFKIEGQMVLRNTVLNLEAGSVLHITSTGVLKVDSTAALCIQQGANVVIEPGGKFILHGKDISNTLLSYLANYDVVLTSSLSNAAVRAYRSIATQGNVLMQDVLLEAGYEIVLDVGFETADTFEARLVPGLYGCLGTPCIPSQPKEQPIVEEDGSSSAKVVSSVGSKRQEGVRVWLDRAEESAFRLRLSEVGDYEVRLYSASGQLLGRWRFEGDRWEIDFRRYARGIYFLGVWRGGVFVKRLAVVW